MFYRKVGDVHVDITSIGFAFTHIMRFNVLVDDFLNTIPTKTVEILKLYACGWANPST